MNEKEIKDKITKGSILCKVVFQMAGNPKDYVENALNEYIRQVKVDPEYIFLKEHLEPCEEGEDGIWSTFLEADILIENFEKLNFLCFNLSPASIEIIEPAVFNIPDKQFTATYNDLISKIHEVGVVIKNLSSENELLKLNINRLIRNCVVISLTEQKTIDEIGTKIGIDKEHLEPFIEAMIKEKTIIKDGEKYKLNK